ncbi:MAG: BolA family protein [Pseudomonadota bacterium]
MNMQEQIDRSLRSGLTPSHLEVVNESSGHNVPAGSETHFKVVAVSEVFAGMSAVKRHQAVYALLREPLAGGVHALALHTYTPDEWAVRGAAPDSPACRGGSAHDRR